MHGRLSGRLLSNQSSGLRAAVSAGLSSDLPTYLSGLPDRRKRAEVSANDDHLPSIGDDGDVYGGLYREATEDDYSGEVTGVVWKESVGPEYNGVRPCKPSADRVSAEGISDLVDAGHGFLVRTLTRDENKVAQTLCKYCNGPLPLPDAEWLCELEHLHGAVPNLTCGCNWCECRRQWESRQFRTAGRPREICDSPDCKRQQKNERQRRYRAKKREAVGV